MYSKLLRSSKSIRLPDQTYEQVSAIQTTVKTLPDTEASTGDTVTLSKSQAAIRALSFEILMSETVWFCPRQLNELSERCSIYFTWVLIFRITAELSKEWFIGCLPFETCELTTKSAIVFGYGQNHAQDPAKAERNLHFKTRL